MNQSPPLGLNVWDHVGRTTGDGTAVYLGDGWALTANHVTVGNVVLGGVSYPVEAGSAVRLNNPDSADGPADLKLFRIVGDPGLPNLPISADAASVGDSLIMVAEGRGRNTALQNLGGGLDGFGWSGAPREKTWADNTIDEATAFFNDISGNKTLAFRTEFQRGVDGDGQAAQWDSGSGTFRFNDAADRWELIGMPIAITGFEGQPAGTAAFGNQTIHADLTVYRDQINAIVPEPTSLILLGGAGAILVRRRSAPLRRTSGSRLNDCHRRT